MGELLLREYSSLNRRGALVVFVYNLFASEEANFVNFGYSDGYASLSVNAFQRLAVILPVLPEVARLIIAHLDNEVVSIKDIATILAGYRQEGLKAGFRWH